MPYSAEVYKKASLVLEERRRTADELASLRKADIYAKFPEIEAMDKELSQNMAKLSMLMLKGGESPELTVAKMKDENDRIQSKKASVLLTNGYAADYLEPQYTCKLCSDIGRKNGILCSCYKKVCLEQAQKELASSSGAAACSFDNFDLSYYVDNGAEDGTNPRRRMNNYYVFCVNYAKNFSSDAPSIVMMGRTGLGKTHLSLSIAKHVIDKGYGVVYLPAQKLISNLEKAHFSNSDEDFLKKYTNCDLLIIDDLGSEFENSFGSSAIANLINERLYENRPTIISTNLSSKEIFDRYSERTASRVLGEYRKLLFIGEDIRFLKNNRKEAAK